MKKVIVSLSAVAALAFAPAAFADPDNWGGWSGEHSDNAASVAYWTTEFGSNGSGNSRYCVDANGSDDAGANNGPTHCDEDGIYSPVVFAGTLTLLDGDQGPGCDPSGHENGGYDGDNNVVKLPTDDNSDETNPCDSATVGSAYLGFAGSGSDGDDGIIGGQL